VHSFLAHFMHVVYLIGTDWHVSICISYWLGELLHWRHQDWNNY